MKVGLVACCLNTPHIRGMGRYVQELLRNSTTAPDISWRLYADNPKQSMASPSQTNCSADVFSFRGDRLHLWEQVGLPMHARRDAVDLLHCTEGSLPWWQPVPTVVTVHDTLAWEESASSGQERFYYDQLLARALDRCARVITISESSRKDIVARWPALMHKVVVIPHGIGQEYLDPGSPAPPGLRQRQLGEQPYLMYLGGPMERKRFNWALRVLAESGRSDLHLVACGFAESSHASRRDALPEALKSRVHFAPFLSDAELRSLYGGATAVLYPTLYEGFGFPAVEAQAAGAPVIFSAVSSLAELVGPLSLVVAADDLPAWCAAVHKAAALGARRRTYAAEAKPWAQRFSWKASFDAHLEVYRQALMRRAT